MRLTELKNDIQSVNKATVISSKDKKERELDSTLPIKQNVQDGDTVILTLPLTVTIEEAVGNAFFELSYSTGKTKIYIDDNKIAEYPFVLAPTRQNITEYADGNEHTLKIEIIHNGAFGEFYFGKIAVHTFRDTYFDIENRGDNGITAVSSITDESVNIIVRATVANATNYDIIKLTLISPTGEETVKICKPTSPECIFIPDKTVFWNGGFGHEMYEIKAELMRDTMCLDSTEVTFGVYRTDFENGFLTLNSIKLPLNGVVMRDGKIDTEDSSLTAKLGANITAIKITPDTEKILTECDKKGLHVWLDMTTPEFDEGQTTRLIQHLASHPSLVFTSSDCEKYENLRSFCNVIKNNSRNIFTAGRSHFGHDESITEAIPDVLFISVPHDTTLQDFSELDLAFSEFLDKNKDCRYAVFADAPEGIFDRHTAAPQRADCSQEYFSLWHEKFWQTFALKKGVFATFAGFLTDGEEASTRTGLVGADKSDIKDVFGFYKAQFSAEPFVRICSANVTSSTSKYIDIRCYTNAPIAELTVNGKKKSRRTSEKLSDGVHIFRHVKLKRQNNTIVVTIKDDTDSTVVFRSKSRLKKV